MRALRRARVDRDDLGVLAERVAEAEPEVHRHADHQRDVGALQPLSARPREASSWSAGMQPRAQPVDEHRDPQLLGDRPQRVLAVRPVEPVPAMITGRSAPRSSSAAASTPRPPGTSSGSTSDAGPSASTSTLHEDVVHREVEERRAAGRASRRGERLVHQRRDLGRRPGRLGEPRQRRDERHVVDLLERAHPPAHRRRTAAEHDHRRAVHQRRAHRAHRVGDARARRQRADARLARRPSPSPRPRTPPTARGGCRRCRSPPRDSRRRSGRCARRRG